MKGYNIAVNSLWPKTVIATAATNNLLGGESLMNISRKPDIMSDAAYIILTSNSKKTTGQFFCDDEVLLSSGVEDLSVYNYDKNTPMKDLGFDFFV